MPDGTPIWCEPLAGHYAWQSVLGNGKVDLSLYDSVPRIEEAFGDGQESLSATFCALAPWILSTQPREIGKVAAQLLEDMRSNDVRCATYLVFSARHAFVLTLLNQPEAESASCIARGYEPNRTNSHLETKANEPTQFASESVDLFLLPEEKDDTFHEEFIPDDAVLIVPCIDLSELTESGLEGHAPTLEGDWSRPSASLVYLAFAYGGGRAIDHCVTGLQHLEPGELARVAGSPVGADGRTFGHVAMLRGGDFLGAWLRVLAHVPEDRRRDLICKRDDEGATGLKLAIQFGSFSASRQQWLEATAQLRETEREMLVFDPGVVMLVCKAFDGGDDETARAWCDMAALVPKGLDEIPFLRTLDDRSLHRAMETGDVPAIRRWKAALELLPERERASRVPASFRQSPIWWAALRSAHARAIEEFAGILELLPKEVRGNYLEPPSPELERSLFDGMQQNNRPLLSAWNAYLHLAPEHRPAILLRRDAHGQTVPVHALRAGNTQELLAWMRLLNEMPPDQRGSVLVEALGVPDSHEWFFAALEANPELAEHWLSLVSSLPNAPRREAFAALDKLSRDDTKIKPEVGESYRTLANFFRGET